MTVDLEDGYLDNRTQNIYIDKEHQLFLLAGQENHGNTPSILVEFNDNSKNFYVPNYDLVPDYKIYADNTDRQAVVIPIPFSSISSEQKDALSAKAEPLDSQMITVSFSTANASVEIYDRHTGKSSSISGRFLDGEVKQRLFPGL